MELGGRGKKEDIIGRPFYTPLFLVSLFFFRSRLSIYMVVVGERRVQSSKSGKESFKEVGDRKTREKITGSRREIPQDEETKFAALVRSHREAEKRCKFEELQAASRKLEKRLYEEDEHLRANKERPGR